MKQRMLGPVVHGCCLLLDQVGGGTLQDQAVVLHFDLSPYSRHSLFISRFWEKQLSCLCWVQNLMR